MTDKAWMVIGCVCLGIACVLVLAFIAYMVVEFIASGEE